MNRNIRFDADYDAMPTLLINSEGFHLHSMAIRTLVKYGGWLLKLRRDYENLPATQSNEDRIAFDNAGIPNKGDYVLSLSALIEISP